MSDSLSETLRQGLPGPRWINELGLAFMSSKVIAAALEFDLFSALSGTRLSATQLSERLSIERDRLERLLTALVSLGLLETDGSYFANQADVEKYLVQGKPSYFGGYLLQFVQEWYEPWQGLEKAIKDGQPPFDQEYYRRLHADPAAARWFTEAGYSGSIAAGHVLAKTFDFAPYSVLLDLGGGSGAYCIAAASRFPHLRAIVLDAPAMLAVAEEFIAKAGLAERIKTYPGDFLRSEYPAGADVILLCSNLHAYGMDQARAIFGRAYAALPAGGAMIWIDYMLDDLRMGPPVAAMIGLSQCLGAGQGRVYTGAEISGVMREVGFVDTVVGEFIPGQLGKVTGKKPS